MSNMTALSKKLTGPIAIFGAGGFIGINLLNNLLKVREDVFGISSDPDNSWRMKENNIPQKNIRRCNLLNKIEIIQMVKQLKPQTIFNLAGYGGYSKQQDVDRIYLTNFVSTVNLIEALKMLGFKKYIHTGSQSEYGLNCRGPNENDELLPNSHYAVSKASVHLLLKYYGKIEKLPVCHLRLYSVYGPWEEPDRLIPTLIRSAKKGEYPVLVDPAISRDFIFIDDVLSAMIQVASKLNLNNYGEAFNIATGKKTTIKQLAYIAKKIFKLKGEPHFGSMKNRRWDLTEWYGNPEKIHKTFGWRATISLSEGLKKCFYYEK